MVVELNDLTLVIQTLGRERYVDRQVRILRRSGARVLLIDGGLRGRDSGWRSRLPDTFSYHHRPGETLPERMRYAASLVVTDFVAVLADDDIFLPSALSTLVNALRSSPGASSAIGRTYRFHVSDGEFRGSQRYDFDQEFETRASHESPVAYVRHNLTLQYNYYALFRRSAWLQNVEVGFGVDYSSPYVSEVAVRLLGALRGNGLVRDVLWWLRSEETQPVSHEGWQRSFTFRDWYIDERTRNERETFTRALSEVGVSEGLWSATDGPENIRSILDEYVRLNSAPTSRSLLMRSFSLARYFRFLPNGCRRVLKNVLSIQHAKSLGVGSSMSSIKDQLRRFHIEFQEDELDWVSQEVLVSNRPALPE